MIPGVLLPDGVANPLIVYDLGGDFNYDDLSGAITKEPPAIRAVIEPLVPRVGSDGNEIGGIHTVLQQAALGTYLGWNISASGFAKGQYCSLAGSYVPFAATKDDRIATLEERYGTQEGYVCVVKRAAQDLLRIRFLLKEDADHLLAQAEASNLLGRNAESSESAKRIAEARCADAESR